MATVANGGTLWKPRLVDRIAPQGVVSKAEVQPRVRMADLCEHALAEERLAALRGALEDEVHSPSPARAARKVGARLATRTS